MSCDVLLLEGNPQDRIEYQFRSDASVEITDIAVGSERRKGKGTHLIEALKAKIKRTPGRWLLLYAITRISNVRAQQFYEKCGFRIVGRLHEFYHNDFNDRPTEPETALMYGLDL